MKEKINSIILSGFLMSFLLLNIIIKDSDISYSERRKLNSFPEINLSFSDKFEKYALDQFVFRDSFRSLKALFNLNILNNMDNNKYVLKDDYIYKLEYPLNNQSVNNLINMINKIKMDLNDNNVYLSVIPDKSYFLDDNYLKLDYDYIFDRMSNIDGVTYIPLNETLSIDDYYKTDTHWKQTSLLKVVKQLSRYMNFNYSNNYSVSRFDNFKGVYYGQLGLKMNTDTLEYLSNNIIENAYVEDIEHPNDNNVYNISKLDSMEPYDVYLNGSTPLISIYNDSSSSDKELIIFRDSFGSSITPLLIESYKKITLVDLRYIDYNLLNNYISIDDQDILFLYSTLLINNSDILKY